MRHLRYLRELLAAQDDPRAALLLEELAPDDRPTNPDWTLEAYLRHRLAEIGSFDSPMADKAGYGVRLVHSAEQWISWRYHGGAERGLAEPEFSSAGEKREFVEACSAIVQELETPEGLEQATRWYVAHVGERLADLETRPVGRLPNESQRHAELRRSAHLADRRELFERLRDEPAFPGYERQAARASS